MGTLPKSLSEITFVSPILFQGYKVNETINTFLLAEDKPYSGGGNFTLFPLGFPLITQK